MSDAEIIDRLRRLLDKRDGVVEKRMVGGRSFSLHDRMFCGAVRDGLMVRVGPDAMAPTLREPHVRVMTVGGKPLAAFVVVEPEAVESDEDLRAWVQRGLDAVAPPASSPEDRFRQLVSRMTRHEDVAAPEARGGAFGSAALKVGGSIFAMLRQDHLVVKLPRERVTELIEAGTGEPFTAGKAAPMREWVTVLRNDEATWTALAEEAREFVRASTDR